MSPKTKRHGEESQAITLEQVRRLASLSKLELKTTEERKLLDELSSILEYFKTVDKVEEIGQKKQETPSESPLRSDEVGTSDPEGVLKGVPRRRGRLVKAPRVF